MEKNSKFTGGFPEVVLSDIHFHGFIDIAFDPHISSIIHFVVYRVAKLELFVSVSEADDLPASTVRNSLLSPPLHPLLVLGNSLPNSYVTDGCWFSFISPFAMFTKSMNDCTILFGSFSIFIIHSKLMHWQPVVFTVLAN